MSGAAFHLSNGIPVYLEPSHALPVVDFSLVFRDGALTDPAGMAGLTRLLFRLMRRGPKGMRANRFDEAVEGLGAELSASVAPGWARLSGSVIAKNLGPFLELVGRIVREPAMRTADLEQLRRETLAELAQRVDHDRALAALAFRASLFGGHPYGRPVSGSPASIAAIGARDIAAHHARLHRGGQLLCGLAGDVPVDRVAGWLEAAFGPLPSDPALEVPLPAPRMARGRRVVLIDKPSRTQAQLYVGALGARLAAPSYPRLLVANTAFGGTFSAPLVQKVRGERGLSYSVDSRLGAERKREAWRIFSQPGSDQLLECLHLELELFERWIERGSSAAQISRAKRYLVRSYPFEVDTPVKRLDIAMDEALYELPRAWHSKLRARVQRVDRASAADAVRRSFAARDLTIVALTTVTPALRRVIDAMPGLRSLEVRPFDAETGESSDR